MHILVIHSESETRRLLYQLLAAEGYDVTLWALTFLLFFV